MRIALKVVQLELVRAHKQEEKQVGLTLCGSGMRGFFAANFREPSNISVVSAFGHKPEKLSDSFAHQARVLVLRRCVAHWKQSDWRDAYLAATLAPSLVQDGNDALLTADGKTLPGWLGGDV